MSGWPGAIGKWKHGNRGMGFAVFIRNAALPKQEIGIGCGLYKIHPSGIFSRTSACCSGVNPSFPRSNASIEDAIALLVFTLNPRPDTQTLKYPKV